MPWALRSRSQRDQSSSFPTSLHSIPMQIHRKNPPTARPREEINRGRLSRSTHDATDEMRLKGPNRVSEARPYAWGYLRSTAGLARLHEPRIQSQRGRWGCPIGAYSPKSRTLAAGVMAAPKVHLRCSQDKIFLNSLKSLTVPNVPNVPGVYILHITRTHAHTHAHMHITFAHLRYTVCTVNSQ